MADFMRIGTFCYNLAHVRQIYKEAEALDEAGNVTNPDTWNVLYEMGTDPRTGNGIISGQVFTGEEGKAVEFYVRNTFPDVKETYKLATDPVYRKEWAKGITAANERAWPREKEPSDADR